MPTPSCSDVSLSNDAKPDGNSYAYCLAAEIRALKTKNLQLRQISEGGTGSNNAASAIENLTGAALATVGQVLTKDASGVIWSTPASGGSGGGDVTGPASSVNGNIPIFDGLTGKVIADSGYQLPPGELADIDSIQALTNKVIGSGCTYAGTRIPVANGGVPDPAPASEGQVLTRVSGTPAWSTPSGAGIGDVSGPISAVDDNLAVFEGATGKVIADSGIPVSGLVNLASLQYLTNKKMLGGCDWNGNTVDETYGGTGNFDYVKGDILYADAADSLARLPVGTTGKVLAVSATGVPEWATGVPGTIVDPYYVDQPAVGSNIAYYNGQSAVATYPHDDYQNVLRVVRGSTDYTGTPTTYVHLGQLDANTVAYKTSAGYQQNLTTDSGGRTLSSAYKARVEHNAMGDVNGFFATISVNGHANMAGVGGNWTGGPSGTVCGGEVYANAAKTNLYGQEFQLYSNGQDNTTGLGAVYGLFRDNSVAAYNNAWIAVRAQSNGTAYSDIAYQVANNFKVAFDATPITMDANKAILTMPVGGRIYLGCPATAWPAMVPTLTGAYIDTDNAKIRATVPFGVIASQAHILKLDASDSALHEIDAASGAIKINVDGDLRYIPYGSTPAGAGGGAGTSGNLLSVLDYGAIGDGVANDTTAIQDCINGCFALGKNMLVPAGTYLVTGLTMNSAAYANHFSIFGEGRNKTIIKKYAASATPVLTIGATSTIFQANVTIEGITFHGLNTTTASTVKAYDMARSSFKDCTFYSGANAFEVVGAVALQFYNCMFDAAQIGVKLTWVAGLNSTPNETLFNGCQIVNNTSWGVYLEHGALCVLDSCEIETNGTAGNNSTGGMYVTNVESLYAALTNTCGIIAQNCWMEDNKGLASFVFNDGRNTVENCYFINNPSSTNDIYVSGGTYKASNLMFMTAKTYNIKETSGVAIGSMITDLSGSGFTPTIAFAAGYKTGRDYGGVQSGVASSDASGAAYITFPRPYPTGVQPAVQITIIADTATSISVGEIRNITNVGFDIRTKAYTGGSVVLATKEFFWTASHPR